MVEVIWVSSSHVATISSAELYYGLRSFLLNKQSMIVLHNMKRPLILSRDIPHIDAPNELPIKVKSSYDKVLGWLRFEFKVNRCETCVDVGKVQKIVGHVGKYG